MGLTAYGASWLWGVWAAAAVVVLADLALTGALHLDAVADVADGWASRLPAERAVEVMRDPRHRSGGGRVAGGDADPPLVVDRYPRLPAPVGFPRRRAARRTHGHGRCDGHIVPGGGRLTGRTAGGCWAPDHRRRGGDVVGSGAPRCQPPGGRRPGARRPRGETPEPGWAGAASERSRATWSAAGIAAEIVALAVLSAR